MATEKQAVTLVRGISIGLLLLLGCRGRQLTGSLPAPEILKVAPAEIAALHDAKTLEWSEQGLSFRVPGDWTVLEHSRTGIQFHPGQLDPPPAPAVPSAPPAVALVDAGKKKKGRTGSIAPPAIAHFQPAPRSFLFSVEVGLVSADLPTDKTMAGTLEELKKPQHRFEVASVRYVEIAGIRGILTETPVPENPKSTRTVSFEGYRKYGSDTESVRIMLATDNDHWSTDRDLVYGLLISIASK